MDIDIQYGRCEVSVISDDVVGGVWSIGRGQVGFRQKDGDFAHLHAATETISQHAHLEGGAASAPERVRRKRVQKRRNALGRSSQVQGRHVQEADAHGPPGPRCKRHGAVFAKREERSVVLEGGRRIACPAASRPGAPNPCDGASSSPGGPALPPRPEERGPEKIPCSLEAAKIIVTSECFFKQGIGRRFCASDVNTSTSPGNGVLISFRNDDPGAHCFVRRLSGEEKLSAARRYGAKKPDPSRRKRNVCGAKAQGMSSRDDEHGPMGGRCARHGAARAKCSTPGCSRQTQAYAKTGTLGKCVAHGESKYRGFRAPFSGFRDV